MRTIVSNPADPSHPDPDVNRWIGLLSAPLSAPLGPGLLGDPSTYAASNSPPKPEKPSNPEVAYAGTLVGQRSDGVVRHCYYDRPGLGIYTIPVPAHYPCDPTAPAPRA
jgi:hypothetical protein